MSDLKEVNRRRGLQGDVARAKSHCVTGLPDDFTNILKDDDAPTLSAVAAAE